MGDVAGLHAVIPFEGAPPPFVDSIAAFLVQQRFKLREEIKLRDEAAGAAAAGAKKEEDTAGIAGGAGHFPSASNGTTGMAGVGTRSTAHTPQQQQLQQRAQRQSPEQHREEAQQGQQAGQEQPRFVQRKVDPWAAVLGLPALEHSGHDGFEDVSVCGGGRGVGGCMHAAVKPSNAPSPMSCHACMLH